MKWLILLLALVAVSPSFAAPDPGRIDNARALASACRPIQRSLANPGRHQKVSLMPGLLCLGYMQAMQDISVLTDEEGERVLGSCPSAKTTLEQLILAFMTYSDSHRDQLDQSAAVMVIKSFRSAFPCDVAGATRADRSRK
jgi:hypothetical protein